MPTDVFEHTLSHLPSIAKDVHVLFHREDKTLRFANVLIPFPRLGIYGNTQIEVDAPFKTKAETKEKTKKVCVFINGSLKLMTTKPQHYYDIQ